MERPLQPITDPPPYPMPPYSDFHAVKHIVSGILCSLLVSLPFSLWQSRMNRAEQQRQQEEHVKRQLIDLEKAARQPGANEAARRLIGIRPQSAPAPQRSSTEARQNAHRE
jgi:hypothetical protein